MNAKSLSGPPMFLKPGCPKADRDGILQTASLCNSSSSSPGFLLFRWRGPGPGGATLVHVGKVEVGPRDRISFLSAGRGGVCLLQLLGQPSRLGPQRSLRERTPPVRGQIFRSMGSRHRGCADNPPLHPSAPGRALSGAAETV